MEGVRVGGDAGGGGLHQRRQHGGDLPPEILDLLLDELELQADDVYEGAGFAAFSDLLQLYSALEIPRLKDPPRPPHPVAALESTSDIWGAIRERDILVHHPYQSFDSVTRFVQEASSDPKVLAIKMTLYRVSPASPIEYPHTSVRKRMLVNWKPKKLTA